MAVKRDITFKNPFTGEDTTATYYFQLDKADALEMDIVHELASMDNPMAYLQQVTESSDSRRMLNLWKELLFSAVGVRDGEELVKGPEIVRKFRQSGAYNQLLSELIEDDDAGAQFFVNVMPDDVREKAAEEAKRTYTKEELLDMPDEQFDLIAGTDIRKMTPEHRMIAMHRLSDKKNKAA